MLEGVAWEPVSCCAPMYDFGRRSYSSLWYRRDTLFLLLAFVCVPLWAFFSLATFLFYIVLSYGSHRAFFFHLYPRLRCLNMFLVHSSVNSHPKTVPSPASRGDQLAADAVTVRLKMAHSSERKLKMNVEGHVANEGRLQHGLLSSQGSFLAAERFDLERAMSTWAQLSEFKSCIGGMFTVLQARDRTRSATHTDSGVSVVGVLRPAVTRLPAKRGLTAVPHRRSEPASRHRYRPLGFPNPVRCLPLLWF